MKTLAIMYPECVDFEIMMAITLLGEKFAVDVATPTGAPHTSKTGIVMHATSAFAEITTDQYGCLLIPGGDPYDLLEDEALHALLRAADQQGLVIGAICAGPLVLAAAGLLEGKRFTHGYGDTHRDVIDPFWTGATLVDSPVVVDGRIITARPEAHVAFGVEIAAMMGAIAPGEREAVTHFYNGRHAPA